MKPLKFPRLGAVLGWLLRLLSRPARPGRKAGATAAAPAPGRVLHGLRLAALAAIAAVITTASAASFAESYRGLWLWARHHSLSGFWAAAFPLQVDAFIVVGELSLFIAMTDRWRLRDRAGAWAVALAGLAVSVAGNIGHVAGGDIQTHGTAAVPPLAAFAALWVGLGVLKRTLNRRDRTASAAAETGRPGTATLPPPRRELPVADMVSAVADMLAAHVPADAEHAALIALRATLAMGNPLSNNQLMTRFGLTRAQVTKVRQQATAGPVGGHHADDTSDVLAAA